MNISKPVLFYSDAFVFAYTILYMPVCFFRVMWTNANFEKKHVLTAIQNYQPNFTR